MLITTRSVDDSERSILLRPGNHYCRCVLTSSPSPTEDPRVRPIDGLVDLRSAAPIDWVDEAGWERAMGRPAATGEIAGPGEKSANGEKAAKRDQTTWRGPGRVVSGDPGEPAAPASSSSAPSVQSASVSTLVLMAREGDARAWAEMVARFGSMIAATGRRYRLTPSDVAELQQTTTWLRLVENLHRIEQRPTGRRRRYVGGLTVTATVPSGGPVSGL